MDLQTFQPFRGSGEPWSLVWLVGPGGDALRHGLDRLAPMRRVVEGASALREAARQRDLIPRAEKLVGIADAAAMAWPREAWQGYDIVCAEREPAWVDETVAIVLYHVLKANELCALVQRELRCDDELAAVVVAFCGNDATAVAEGLWQLRFVDEPLSLELLDRLWGDGLPDGSEDVLRNWMANDAASVWDYWRRHGSDNLFKALSQLYTVLKQQIMVRGYAGTAPPEIAKKTGLTVAQIRRWQKMYIAYSVEQMFVRLLWVQQLEVAVRSGILTKTQAWLWLMSHWFLLKAQ